MNTQNTNMQEQQQIDLGLLNFLKDGIKISETDNNEFVTEIGDWAGFDSTAIGSIAKAILTSLVESGKMPDILINNQKVNLKSLYYDKKNNPLHEDASNSMALKIIRDEGLQKIKQHLVEVSEEQAFNMREKIKIDILFEEDTQKFYTGDPLKLKALSSFFPGYEILKAS